MAGGETSEQVLARGGLFFTGEAYTGCHRVRYGVLPCSGLDTAESFSEIMPASVIANVAGPSVDQIAAELSAVVFNDAVVLPSKRKAVRLTLERLAAVSLESGR